YDDRTRGTDCPLARGMRMTEPQTSIATYLTLIILASVLLKLSGIVGWSWWFVFTPLWIVIFIVGLIIVVVVVARLRERNYW
ncbi:hypothetical protein LCGC14_2952770, partial [marine sediment metagenome]